MALKVIVVDGLIGGINTNVIKVISQTVETSAAPFTMAANRGYILTRDGLVQDIFFPAAPLVGDIYYLQGKGTGLFRLEQFGTQQVLFGNKETIAGGTGYIESTNKNDSMFIICVVAAGTASVFSVMPSPQGNFNMNTAGGIVSQNATNNASGSPNSGGNGSLYAAAGGSKALAAGAFTIWDAGVFANGAIMDNFTRATTRLTYTGVETKEFKISMNLATEDVQAGEFQGAIFKNGGGQSQSLFQFANRSAGGAGDTNMTSSGSVDLTLSTNDYIEPFVKASNSVTLDIEHLSLFANQLR